MSIEHTTVVIDASAVVALLCDAGAAGTWVLSTVSGVRLLAPELMPYEVANILRRHVLAGRLGDAEAALAHHDLIELARNLYPYRVTADDGWRLRGNITTYDASYVALAEMFAVPLVTLDARLSRSPGIKCKVLSYASFS